MFFFFKEPCCYFLPPSVLASLPFLPNFNSPLLALKLAPKLAPLPFHFAPPCTLQLASHTISLVALHTHFQEPIFFRVSSAFHSVKTFKHDSSSLSVTDLHPHITKMPPLPSGSSNKICHHPSSPWLPFPRAPTPTVLYLLNNYPSFLTYPSDNYSFDRHSIPRTAQEAVDAGIYWNLRESPNISLKVSHHFYKCIKFQLYTPIACSLIHSHFSLNQSAFHLVLDISNFYN